FAGARPYALQARQLRPKSTWDKDDIVQLLAYLRGSTLPATSEEVPDPAMSAPSTDEEATTVAYAPPPPPAVKETSPEGPVVNDDECEPVARPERRTAPTLAGGWCVVVGIGIGAVLIMLFRQALAGCQA